MKGWSHLPPADANVAEYLTKQKSKGHSLSPADEKFLNACIASKHNEWKPPPGAEKYEKNEVAIAKAVYEDWSFGYLPEKVCSLASYCRNKKQKGLSLTPVEERFFAQLVNVCIPEETDKEKKKEKRDFFKNVMQTMLRKENVDCLLIPMKPFEPLVLVFFEFLFKKCVA